LSITVEDVRLYPAPAIYAGDKVTFQVWPNVPDEVPPNQVTIHIAVDGTKIADGIVGGRSHLSREAVGLFEWVWNTTGLSGTYLIEVTLDKEDIIRVGDENPDNNLAAFEVSVNDPQLLSANEVNAIWKTTEIPCCRVHVVSRTAADRDLPDLLNAIDQAVQRASDRLGETPQKQLDIYLIDKVIGQGGYAGSEMVVSYLDRDYASTNLDQVLTHEAVHLLDRQFAPQRLAFFAEGLAVWASGGHYKQQDIDQATAALLELNRYIPLDQLIDDFYPVQHEIGYLQAAGLVKYLVDAYGMPRFRAFYSQVTPDDGESLSRAVDRNLQAHYGLSLSELEARWLAYLAGVGLDRTIVLDLQTSIDYYDVVRRYQRQYDPSAHFLLAWLPSPNGVQDLGNPADLTRHPRSPLNITLEVMLQDAGDTLNRGGYARANALIDSVARVIDNGGHFIDPFSIGYWNVVQAAAAMGYEVQQVTLLGDEAFIQVTASDAIALTRLNLVLQGRQWALSN
jgi:hypothetical protein